MWTLTSLQNTKFHLEVLFLSSDDAYRDCGKRIAENVFLNIRWDTSLSDRFVIRSHGDNVWASGHVRIEKAADPIEMDVKLISET